MPKTVKKPKLLMKFTTICDRCAHTEEHEYDMSSESFEAYLTGLYFDFCRHHTCYDKRYGYTDED